MLQPKRTLGFVLFLLHHAAVLRMELAASHQAIRPRGRVCEIERLPSSVRDRLIQIVLGIGAGAAVVGRFGLAYRVVFAPNSLVYSAVSPVFFGIASRGSKLSVGRFAAGLVEAAVVALGVPYSAFAI